jgi:hypothetical protein
MTQWTHPATHNTSANPQIVPGFLSAYEVMARFQICKRTLWVWHQKGLPKYPLGKLILYKETELAELFLKNKKIARKNRPVKKQIRKKNCL